MLQALRQFNLNHDILWDAVKMCWAADVIKS